MREPTAGAPTWCSRRPATSGRSGSVRPGLPGRARGLCRHAGRADRRTRPGRAPGRGARGRPRCPRLAAPPARCPVATRRQPAPRIICVMPGWYEHPTGLPRYRCLRLGGRLTSYPPSAHKKTGLRHRFCSSACYRASIGLVKVMRFWAKVVVGPGCWEWSASRPARLWCALGRWLVDVRPPACVGGDFQRRAGGAAYPPHLRQPSVRPAFPPVAGRQRRQPGRHDAEGPLERGQQGHASWPRLTEPELAAHARNYLAHVRPPRMLRAADLGLTIYQATAIVRHSLATV